MYTDYFFNVMVQKSISEQLLFLIGLILLFFGQRTYRYALFIPSFFLGFSLMFSYFLDYATVVRLGIALGIGVIGVGLVMAIEQFAISLVGAFLGGAFMHYLGWDLYMWFQSVNSGTKYVEHLSQNLLVPWYYTSISAFLGAFLFSKFFERYLPITTSFCASAILCWSLDYKNIYQYHIFLLFWFIGCIFQYFYQPSAKSMYSERS
jgi:hypothetical protein